MEDVRYAASFAAGPSNKDKIKELGDKHQNLRHVKEKSEGSQELVQRIEGGLAHIAELLGTYVLEYLSHVLWQMDYEAIDFNKSYYFVKLK